MPKAGPIDIYGAIRRITKILKQIPTEKRGPILHLSSLEAISPCTGCLDENGRPINTGNAQGTAKRPDAEQLTITPL